MESTTNKDVRSNNREMSTIEKTIDLLHALPDTGRTLEEYREERIRGKYEAAD